MRRVVFSEAARVDRREITAYTVERFGIEQARALRGHFESTLSTLAQSPLMGHTNEELDPPGHTFRYWVVMKRFILVYQPADDGLRVARILHGARSLVAELGRDAGDAD
jgi:plasmid stabilization system protein ParE